MARNSTSAPIRYELGRRYEQAVFAGKLTDFTTVMTPKVKSKFALLIDNEESTRQDAKTELEKAGYEVKACPDPSTGMRFIETQKESWLPTLVLVDIVLVGIGGFEMARRISEFYSSKVQIVMLGRHFTAEDVAEACNAGAKGVIRKPLRVADLRALQEKIKMRELQTEIGDIVFNLSSE